MQYVAGSEGECNARGSQLFPRRSDWDHLGGGVRFVHGVMAICPFSRSFLELDEVSRRKLLATVRGYWGPSVIPLLLPGKIDSE